MFVRAIQLKGMYQTMAVLVISFILLCLFQSSLSIPVSPTKRAFCPAFEPPAECPSEIDHICLHDNQCSKGLICCNTGCQQDCVTPLYSTPSKATPGPAFCPSFEPPAQCPEELVNFCRDDSTCPLGLKCCNTGCELDCVAPLYSTPSKTTPVPAVCPTFEPPPKCPEEVVNFCLEDIHCPNGLKCCNTGCILDCVVPDYSKPSKTPSISSVPNYFKPSKTPLTSSAPLYSTPSKTTPVSLTRPGVCPKFEPPPKCPEEVENFCLEDIHCPNGLTCCYTGCILDCVAPLYSTPSKTTPVSPTGPAVCPTFEPPHKCPEFDDGNFCLEDIHCPNGLKCCNTGCELDCVVPDYSKPNKTPSTSSVSPTKRALCPKFELPAECPSEIDHICFHDNQCSKGLICCNTGCKQDCVMPDYSKPSKTPSTSSVPNYFKPSKTPLTSSDACKSYKVLNSADRAQGNKDQTNVTCDQHLASGWYRFEGDAGDRMPDKCVPMRRCGTHAPGWIDGNHPTVAEGVVTRKVCFHWLNNCCLWHNKIKVENCGAYFVYKIFWRVPECSARYCGNAGAESLNFTSSKTPLTTPGVCPIVETPSNCPETESPCYDDSHCPTDMKCCSIGCARDCVRPVYSTPSKPPSTSSAPLFSTPSKTPSTTSAPSSLKPSETSSTFRAENCGGVLTNSSGEITSPNYPNNYPDDITCTWKISPGKTHVNVTIEDFMVEDSQNCKEFDFVKITVQSGRYSTEEVNICGSLPSRELNLKVDGTAVEITFTSDLSINDRGFKISYRSYDIDPCLENNGGCSHNCSLVKGKRVCSCPAGEKLIYDLRTCKDENSCHFVGRKKCPWTTKSSCKDLPDGNTTCVCWRGYKRQHGTCQDFDECKEIPGRCGVGVCHNRRGYFYCSCPKGYRSHWQSNGETCKDNDECSSYRPPNCGKAVCVNTPGSYICQCEPGYKFNDTLKTCEDDDECAVGSSGCDHVCSNTNGSFSCSCHPGYFLDSDGKTCRAVKVESLGRVRKTKACQGELLTMSCKDSLNTLIIFKASYAGDSEVCPYKPDKPLPFKQIFEGKDNKDSVSCREDVTDKIKKWCGWSKECRLTVNPAIGESCRPGANRYLSVAYSCGRPLKCSPLPRSNSCSTPVKDECKSDDDCKNTQMCCFDGCKKACLKPALYNSKNLKLGGA